MNDTLKIKWQNVQIKIRQVWKTMDKKSKNLFNQDMYTFYKFFLKTAIFVENIIFGIFFSSTKY